MKTLKRCASTGFFAASLMMGCQSMTGPEGSPLVRYGSMHEVIGQRQDEGRVAVEDVARTDSMYAVGALAGLTGEVTIIDSVVTASSVGPDGSVRPAAGENLEAALFVGQAVESWMTVEASYGVPQERFDAWVARAVAEADLDDAVPLMFVIDGEFTDVHLHVINGACPVHARIKGLTLDPASAPYELETDRMRGTLVGVFAPDAVGTLTHPATSTHAHLVFVDPTSGQRVTGHLERIGVSAGARLRLAAPR